MMRCASVLCVVAALLLSIGVVVTPAFAATDYGPVADADTHYFVSLWSKVYPVKYLWSGDNMCAWEGISCDTAKAQVTMLLPRVGLKGTIPTWGSKKDFNPANVRVVSINLALNAELTGPFPAHYGQLKKLQELYLIGTGLSGTIPAAWNSLTNLVIVDVSNTQACGGLPAWSKTGLPNLQYMHFANNSLMRGSIPASLASFGAVSFNASDSPICGCLPDEFESSLYMLVQIRQDLPQVTSEACSTLNRCTASGLTCNSRGDAASRVASWTGAVAAVAAAVAVFLGA